MIGVLLQYLCKTDMSGLKHIRWVQRSWSPDCPAPVPLKLRRTGRTHVPAVDASKQYFKETLFAMSIAPISSYRSFHLTPPLPTRYPTIGGQVSKLARHPELRPRTKSPPSCIPPLTTAFPEFQPYVVDFSRCPLPDSFFCTPSAVYEPRRTWAATRTLQSHPPPNHCCLVAFLLFATPQPCIAGS